MRIKVSEKAPEAYKLLVGLHSYLNTCELTKKHLRLIQIRASQINKCANCVNIHIKEAIEEGDKESRIHMISLWEETGDLFSVEERTILKMTEEITNIKEDGLSDETYENAVNLFSETYVGLIIMAIVTINSFNRIAIAAKIEFKP